MTPLRVVLDNKVVLSTVAFRSGRLSWLLAAWQASVIVTLATWETIAELRRVLGYEKFGLSLSLANRGNAPIFSLVRDGHHQRTPERS